MCYFTHLEQKKGVLCVCKYFYRMYVTELLRHLRTTFDYCFWLWWFRLLLYREGAYCSINTITDLATSTLPLRCLFAPSLNVHPCQMKEQNTCARIEFLLSTVRQRKMLPNFYVLHEIRLIVKTVATEVRTCATMESRRKNKVKYNYWN